MSALVIAISLTLLVSAFCSLLEAFVLSTTTVEIEDFKRVHPRLGAKLEAYRLGIDETSSAILILNTIANTAGATVSGALAGIHYPEYAAHITVGLVFGILLFSEIIPKNIGVTYRKGLRVYLTWPLAIVRITMKPFALPARHLLKALMKKEVPSEEEQEKEMEKEIILLAEKSAEKGALSDSERDLISNALSLDDVRVESIMTPRTVVTFLEDRLTVEEVCRDFKNIPFARMPVYSESIDNIVGVVRRRDILQAYSEDKDLETIRSLMGEVVYVPETASALNALQLFLKRHQQIAVVVDEYGSTAGVVTMEDIVEHLVGDEIYEESDVAVDMRELAARRALRSPAASADEAHPAPAEAVEICSEPPAESKS